VVLNLHKTAASPKSPKEGLYRMPAPCGPNQTTTKKPGLLPLALIPGCMSYILCTHTFPWGQCNNQSLLRCRLIAPEKPKLPVKLSLRQSSVIIRGEMTIFEILPINYTINTAGTHACRDCMDLSYIKQKNAYS
jgi:hypothetical protein